MKVCVLGLGQIGFPVAEYVAKKGLEVWGYDINPKTIDRIGATRNLKATTNWQEIPIMDVYIICVTTGQTNESPDISAVYEVSKKIAEKASSTTLVSIESTIIPGTTNHIYNDIFKGKTNIVHCPHRYWADDPEKHGVNQPRVIGAVNTKSLELGLKFYRDTLGIPMFSVSTAEVAEMCKISENSHRYLQIAYAEELKLICSKTGMNFGELRDAMNTKWNVDLPEARDGIGRHCLPKDIRYVMSLSPEEAILLHCATEVDKKYREWLGKETQKK